MAYHINDPYDGHKYLTEIDKSGVRCGICNTDIYIKSNVNNYSLLKPSESSECEHFVHESCTQCNIPTAEKVNNFENIPMAKRVSTEKHPSRRGTI